MAKYPINSKDFENSKKRPFKCPHGCKRAGSNKPLSFANELMVDWHIDAVHGSKK